MTWEEKVIEYMTAHGWTCDVNDENRLGFVFKEDEEHEWTRDYDKKTRTFVQFNGKQKVTLISNNCPIAKGTD